MRDVKYPFWYRLRFRLTRPLLLAKFSWDRLRWQDAVAFGLFVRAVLIAASLSLAVVLVLS